MESVIIPNTVSKIEPNAYKGDTQLRFVSTLLP